jgi:microcystin-dependent protein
MAFDLDTCPAGWTDMAAAQGRAVVGLERARPQRHAGSDAVTLTTQQLPMHAHAVGTLSIGGGDHSHSIPCRQSRFGEPDHPHAHDNMWADTVAPAERSQTEFCAPNSPSTAAASHTHTLAGQTAPTGQGAAVDNRQASLVLLYCRKN